MVTVMNLTPFRSVHDVNVKSIKNRLFVVDIYKNTDGNYDSEVTALDNISAEPGSWLFKVQPTSPSASDNYKAAIQLIQHYLKSVDSADAIADISNPCNCPFIAAIDQNAILSTLGLNLTVRVN